MTRHWAARKRRDSLSTLHYPLVTLLLVLVGCGTSEYERRLSTRSSKMQGQAAAKFSELGPPQVLPGTSVSISMPNSFSDAPLVEGAVDARRVKPGIITIPGLKLTREGFIQDSGGGQMAYYCYVGVTGGPLQNVAGQLQNELSGKQGKVTPWTDFQGESPTGAPLQWRKLRFDGAQDFYYKNKAGQEQFLTLAGVLEVYLYDAGPQVVVVAWRMPASIELNVGLARLAPLVAGSVSVKK